MRKILTGFLGLFVTIGLVAGVGYALFSSTVNLNGMVLGTATPGLKVSLDGTNYYPSLDLTNIRFAPLLPGEMDWGEIWVRNTSNGGTDKLDMNLQARITAAGGDWGVLKDAVQMRVCVYKDITGYNCDETQATNWLTLAQWNANPITLPANPLEQGLFEKFTIVFRVPSSYGNEIAGKQITGMNIELTGTQVL